MISLSTIRRAAAVTALCCLIAGAPAEASPFSSIIVTGDSWVDDGMQSEALKRGYEVWQINPAQLTVARPNGRFSNGPAAPEYLAAMLGMSGHPENYAIGGAASGSNFEPFRFPFEMQNRPGRNWNGVDSQLTFLLNEKGGVLDPNALYFLSIGGNDFLEALPLGWTPNAATTHANIVDGLSRMANAGARHFMVINYRGPADNNINVTITGAYIEAKQTLGIDIIYIDSASLIRHFADNPALFGFDPNTPLTPCISGTGVNVVNNCTPEQEAERIMWDLVHPSTRTHELIALAAYSQLTSPQVLAVLGDGTLVNFGRTQRRALSGFGAGRGQGGAVPLRVASAAGASDATTYNFENAWGRGHIFLQAERLLADRTATSLDPAVKAQATSETIGFRFSPSPVWSVGAAATLLHGRSSVTGGTSSDSTHIVLTALGGWSPDYRFAGGRPFADLALSAGYADLDSRRNPGIAGSVAAGSTSARQLGASLVMGHDIGAGGATLTPRIGLHAARIEVDGFSETGAPAGFNLLVGKQTIESLTGEIGVDLRMPFPTSWATLTPSVSAGWNHEFADRSRSITVAPTSQPLLSFSGATAAGDDNYGEVAIGLEAALKDNLRFSFGYSRSFARDDWETEAFGIGLSFPL